MPSKTYVYWIHYPHHSDPSSEGYIGVSYKPQKRYRSHSRKSSSNNRILYRAIKKGAILTILYQFDTKEKAFLKEEELRPGERIGWNIIPGGDSKPPIHFGNKYNLGNHNKKHSEDFKDNMSFLFSQLKWFNNGEKNIRVRQGTEPDGFVAGRLPIQISPEGIKKRSEGARKSGLRNLGRKHSTRTKQKISEKTKGALNPCAKPVFYKGQQFATGKSLREFLGISTTKYYKLIKNGVICYSAGAARDR